jgi:hypothetical protein
VLDPEEADPVAATIQQQMLRDLDEKVDDIHRSVTTMAIAQATAAGDVKVLATEFKGFQTNVEDRIEALEAQKNRDEWQAWAERLAAAILGAGGLELARRFLAP